MKVFPVLRRLAGVIPALFRRLHTFDRPNVQVRLSLRQWLIFPALLLALLWYLLKPTGPSITAVVILGGLLLTAYLWARSMARGVSGKRKLLYSALQVGDELVEQVTLVNTSFLPALWAEFSDRSNLPGYTVSSVRSAEASQTTTWRAHTVCSSRGVFSLGPWDLRLGDPFGIFEVRQTYLEKSDILVYPPIAALPPRLVPRGRTQGEQRTLNQPLLAETQSAFTARPYVPGDPLRHMHWPTTARREAPFVKVFEPEASSSVWLLADTDTAAHAGAASAPDSTLETMVLLLSSLAARLLQEGMAVGLFALTGAPDSPPLTVLPRRGALHQWDIMRTLAVLKPADGCPFATTLNKARSLVSGRDLVVAVTPALQPDWLPALHPFTRSRQRSAAQVILIDPAAPAAHAVGAGLAPAQDKVGAFVTLLAEQGVRAAVVRRGELAPLLGAYGELNRWEFKTLATGRIFVRHAPRPTAGLPAAPSPTGAPPAQAGIPPKDGAA